MAGGSFRAVWAGDEFPHLRLEGVAVNKNRKSRTRREPQRDTPVSVSEAATTPGLPPRTGRSDGKPGDFPASDKVWSTHPIHPLSETKDESPSLLDGTIVEARYRFQLGKSLGGGALGQVFLADCLDHIPGDPGSIPAQAALKVLFPPKPDEAARMLRRELSSLLAFEHDRVPHVYDWRIGDPFCYVAMQYFPEGSADVWPRRGEAIDELMAWQMLDDLLSALQAAHNASVLHLDIKPSNILLDGEGGFVLADFGISQGLMAANYSPDAGLGTVGYRAPEQARMEWDRFDERTDLWGLGATVWSMLTGIILWKREELLLFKDPEEKLGLPKLSAFRPGISPALEEIIMALVASLPNDRPGSAAEVLARVERRDETGGNAGRCAEMTGSPCGPEDVQKLIGELLDPLWITVVRNHRLQRHLWLFDDGEYLCRQGDRSYCIFILLQGVVEIDRGGERLATDRREGTFLGEIAAMTGGQRTASVRARGQVYALRFNLAQFERLIALEPALAIRLIKSLAERLARDLMTSPDGAEEDRS